MAASKKRKRKSSPSSQAPSWWQHRAFLYLGGIFVLTLFAFWQITDNQFINWDDGEYVVGNRLIQGWSLEHLWGIFTTQIAANYHPLTIISLAFNYQIGGLNPSNYFFTNLLLHLFNTGLVFYFCYLLSRKKVEVAAIAACFFAIHPMHVESVAWISERKDVLYVFFFMASCIAYLWYLQNKRSRKYYYWSIGLFVCSLLSKAMAVVLPVVLLLIDYWLNRLYRNGKWNRKALEEKIPYFVLALLFGILAAYIQTTTGAVRDLERYTWLQKFVFACYGFVTYILKFFFPYKLSAFYPYPDVSNGLPSYFWLMSVVALGIIGGVAYSMRRTRLLAFGVGFYWVTVVLVLQFLTVGDALMADRYSYLSYVGLLFLVAMGIYNFAQKQSQSVRYGIGIALVVLSFYWTHLSHQQAAKWQNPIKLWTSVIEIYPNEVAIAYNNRANIVKQTQPEKAIPDYLKAIEIQPDYGEAYNNFGNLYLNQKDYTKALELFDKALQYKPNMAELHYNRGNVFFEQKQLEEALKNYLKTVELKPSYTEVYLNLSNTYRLMNQPQKALESLSKMIESLPDFRGHFNRGLMYREFAKDCNKAIPDFRAAHKFAPNNPNPLLAMGDCQFNLQQFSQAVNSYSKVLTLQPQNLSALANRASAYLQLKDYQKGMVDINRVLQANPQSPNAYMTRSFLHNAQGNLQQARKDALMAQQMGVKVDEGYLQGLGN